LESIKSGKPEFLETVCPVGGVDSEVMYGARHELHALSIFREAILVVVHRETSTKDLRFERKIMLSLNLKDAL
jgi:hypothetical protein